jgi:two-component system, chemotaxis family, CheB/CheR fusion protein
LRVVVVDDLPDTVMMLLTLIRNDGYEAVGFSSGREALKNLERFDPDVVISDIAMPSVNGWDLAREIRRARGDARPMLIGISGKYMGGADKALAEIAGYNYYLTKPFDPKVLMELIKLAPTGGSPGR